MGGRPPPARSEVRLESVDISSGWSSCSITWWRMGWRCTIDRAPWKGGGLRYFACMLNKYIGLMCVYYFVCDERCAYKLCIKARRNNKWDTFNLGGYVFKLEWINGGSYTLCWQAS
jgi:hypothetical protein